MPERAFRPLHWGMVLLKSDECRVLGVLVEKAQTTPGQYPITLNGLTNGCNQKNNRHPVVEWDEERVFDAVAAGQFYIYSHPKAIASVQTRLEDVLQARNPSDPFAGKPEIGAALRAALSQTR